MWAADKHGLPASLSAVPYPLRRSIRNRQSIPPHRVIQTGYTHNDPACAIEDASRPHKIKNNWWPRSWAWLCRIAGACIIGIRGLVVLFCGQSGHRFLLTLFDTGA